MNTQTHTAPTLLFELLDIPAPPDSLSQILKVKKERKTNVSLSKLLLKDVAFVKLSCVFSTERVFRGKNTETSNNCDDFKHVNMVPEMPRE